jgi:hypothetical protein
MLGLSDPRVDLMDFAFLSGFRAKLRVKGLRNPPDVVVFEHRKIEIYQPWKVDRIVRNPAQCGTRPVLTRAYLATR